MNNTKDRSTSAGDSRAPEHIKDINCEVKNCSYNDEERYCTANRVNIGPCCANSTPETVCATFKPKSGSAKSESTKSGNDRSGSDRSGSKSSGSSSSGSNSSHNSGSCAASEGCR